MSDIDLLGSEDEKKGIEATKAIIGEQLEKEKKREEKEIDNLNFKSRNIISYKKILGDLLRGYLMGLDWPKGAVWDAGETKDGVALIIRYKNKTYARGIKPIMNELYDHYAIKTLVTQADNTIGRITGRSDREDSGTGGDSQTAKGQEVPSKPLAV